MGHTFCDLTIHIIFSTKHRHSYLTKDLCHRLYPYISAIARDHQAHILSINGVEDHIHLLLQLKTSESLSRIMRYIKAGSSHWIHQTFPSLKDFAWQAGYGAFSVSHSGREAVIRYIDNQEIHHQKVTFEEEYKAFLEKHEIDFHPEHYLD